MMDYFIAFIIIIVVVFLWDWFEKPKQADKKHYSEEEIALAEFLEKRQEINELFLAAKAEMRKISRKIKGLFRLDKWSKYVEIYYWFIA